VRLRHFLIAAAHRIGKHLAIIRTGESEPPPEKRRQALRDVVSHCIYGVDLNPLAVELCKVALWIETLDPGRPLGFLDHRIKCGNSLIGATPELLANGIPDDAFKPMEGDNSTVASSIRRKNREERRGQQSLFMIAEDKSNLKEFASAFSAWAALPEETAQQVTEKAKKFESLQSDYENRHQRQLADLWTAAFFWPLGKETYNSVPTQDFFRRFRERSYEIPPKIYAQMEDISSQHRFFHWYLEFPEVFTSPNPSPSMGETPSSTPSSPAGEANLSISSPLMGEGEGGGGFDVVLGNPPWERIKLQEKEFFAQKDAEIANAPNAAARKRLIAQLQETNPSLWSQFLEAKRSAECESHFLRASERYPLSAVGDINTYQIFAGLARELVSWKGRVGIVIPSGIATDDTNKQFFADLTEKQALISLYDFENREGIFPGVHRSYKFCLLTMGAESAAPKGADFAFFLTNTGQLREDDRHFSLSAEDIALLNPNTHTCPIFRSKRDAEITKEIYRRVPVLIDESKGEAGNPWGISFLRMLDMANDSHLFRTREQLEAEGWKLEGNSFLRNDEKCLPLYEAKMTNLFDHRHGSIVGSEDVAELSGIPAEGTTLAEHHDANHRALPRYWVPSSAVAAALLRTDWRRGFFLSTRDVARATDIRTAIQAIIPAVGVGHKAPLILPMESKNGETSLFLGNLNSFVLDFMVRQKIGGASLSYFIIKQLPVLPPTTYTHSCPLSGSSQTLRGWLLPRVLELTYTAWDLEPFAQDCGWTGPPFRWDQERRFLLRCELDAAFFHLYLPSDRSGDWIPARVAEGAVRDETLEDLARLKTHFPTPRHAVDYIMDTFPIVKRKDEEKHGEYRTKRVILEIYDEMTEAMRTETAYKTRLNPPPGPPADEHGNLFPLVEWKPGQPKPGNWPSHIHPPWRHGT